MKISAVFFLLIFLTISLMAGEKAAFDFIVAKDGSGDFKSVQDAINAVPDFRKERTTIYIKDGIYKEKLLLPASKNKVSFIGQSVEKTILTNDDYASKKNRFGEEMGTTGSSSFFIFGNEFTAQNITFENSAGEIGQAVAVRVTGDQAVFVNCRFLGNQDTLYPQGENSRQYYKNCYIEGTVDFIFGWSTAVFDRCTIFAKRHGYITAASTSENSRHGFVFLNCKIEGSAEPGSVYLGRPWRPYAQTVFIECEMSAVVHPAGWHNWNKTEAEQSTFYAEYRNTGEGAAIAKRVHWSHQLSEDQRNNYTIEKIFIDWNPLEQAVEMIKK